MCQLYAFILPQAGLNENIVLVLTLYVVYSRFIPMKRQNKQQITAFLKHLSLTRAALLFIALCTPVLLIAPTANAQTKQTAESFCKQYSSTSLNYACKDGWKGADCSDYLITHDQSHVDTCQSSARKAAEVGSGGDTPESMGTPTTNTSNNLEGLDTIKQLIDQIQTTQEQFGKTSPKNVDDVPDNTYGKYINGNGDKQDIRVSKANGSGRPAIIFFNGGGWHTDDRVGDKVAPLANARGYSTFVATYRLGSSGIYYQYEDVMRAIKHVRNNAQMYGIDPSRIAIWGDSAGGSLAMRAAASGKSGAAAAVGWSAPTNAYTAILHSFESFAIGMDHSTCIPTDANGLFNAIDTLGGGTGDIAPNDGGLGNNNIESFQNGDALGSITQVLTLAQRAQRTSSTANSLASGLKDNTDEQTEQSARQLTSRKMIECIDNFNSASPALFASPLTPPTFLAGFDRDRLIHPGQLYQMRDKLRAMGVTSEVLTLPGVESNKTEPGQNHLDYNEAFVNPTLNFLDRHLR